MDSWWCATCAASPWRRPAIRTGDLVIRLRELVLPRLSDAAQAVVDDRRATPDALATIAGTIEETGRRDPVVGRHDGLTLPRIAFEHAHRLPRARLHVFERSGHRPWCEEPDAYVDVVDGFLDSLQG